MWKNFQLSGAIALGFFCALILFEIILTFIGTTDFKLQNDSASGLLTYQPQSSFTDISECFQNDVRINVLGFHAPNIQIEKPEKVFRILVTGNSFVEALQVPTDKLFTSALQDELNSDPDRLHTYEVIPLGFSGNATYLDALYYSRFGSQLHPDLVIDLATGNEVARVLSTDQYPPRFDPKGNLILELPKAAKSSTTVALKNFLRKSRLFTVVRSRIVLLASKIAAFRTHPNLFLATSDTVAEPGPETAGVGNDEEWKIEGSILSAYSKAVKKDGAHLLLTSWTGNSTATSTAEELPTRLKAIASTSGFSYVDLVGTVAEQENRYGISATLMCDGHWSEAGHRYAGHALYEYLKAHPTLLKFT